MYNLIFFYIYRQQLNKGKDKDFAIYNGSLIVSLAAFFHLATLYVIIEKVIKYEPDLSILKYYKSIEIVVIGLYMLIIYRYFSKNKKRIAKIEEQYSNNEIIKSYGGIIVAGLIFVPLLLFIILLS